MRIGVLLLVCLGLVSAAACTSTATKDEDCIVSGGVCFTSLDLPGCTNVIEAQCSAGYTCCGMAYGANIVDGAVIDAPTGAPSQIDGGVVDGATDGAADGAKDGAKADGAASHDGQADAPDATGKDATAPPAPIDAGHGVDAAKADAGEKPAEAGKADGANDSGSPKDVAVLG